MHECMPAFFITDANAVNMHYNMATILFLSCALYFSYIVNIIVPSELVWLVFLAMIMKLIVLLRSNFQV